MASVKNVELIFDDWHSLLLERFALQQGLIPQENWHALPEVASAYSKSYVGARIRTVRRHFETFCSVESRRNTVDTLLSTMCLFPDCRLSRKYFKWRSDCTFLPLAPAPSIQAPLVKENWRAAVEEARQIVTHSSFDSALRTFEFTPTYLFAKHMDAAQRCGDTDWEYQNLQFAHRIESIRYWAKRLKSDLIELVFSCLTSPPTELEYGVISAFSDFSHTMELKAAHRMPVLDALERFSQRLAEHAITLAYSQLRHGRPATSTTLNIAPAAHDYKALADTVVMVRANFSEHLKVSPAPRTFEEAIELSAHPAVSRLAQLITIWSESASNADFDLEKKIAAGLEKAARELRLLSQVRAAADSHFGVWVKAIGAHIPVFSSILSAAEVALFYVSRAKTTQHCWISTA